MINTLRNTIICGDCLDVLKTLPDKCVHCCVSSPPYWGLRDYGVDGQLGLEKTPDDFIDKLVDIFRDVRRVLRPDGTCWVNLGDSYTGIKGNTRGDGAGGGKERGEVIGFGGIGNNGVPVGLKPKEIVGIPWRFALAAQADGWYLRQDIIWHKPNPMPESVTDRCTKSHEYIFLLTKSPRYWYDHEAIKEEGAGVSGGGCFGKQHDTEGTMAQSRTYDRPNYSKKNKRSVWTVNTYSFPEAHFATYPPKLIEPCIRAGCPEGGIVLDPFMGAGTTGLVAYQNRRDYIGIELNPEYKAMAERRLQNEKDKLALFAEAE